MASKHASAYRHILRELTKASNTRRAVSKTLMSSVRAIFEAHRPSEPGHESHLARDIQNAIAFMRSQREYNELLARYNPLLNLTAEDRIKATARRVGLDMPITLKSDE